MQFHTFKDVIYYIIGLLQLAIPVVAGLALLMFLWGLAKFISNSGDPKSHDEGKSLMIWGVVALFVMISFLGLISIAQGVFGLKVNTALPIIKPNN